MSTLKSLDPLAPGNSPRRVPTLTPREFVDSQCQPAKDAQPSKRGSDWIPAKALYTAYVQYCRRHELRPVSSTPFYKRCGYDSVNNGQARCYPLVLTDKTLQPLKTIGKRDNPTTNVPNGSADIQHAELDGPSVARVFKLLSQGKAPREVVTELELPAALVASAARQYAEMGPPPEPPKVVEKPVPIPCKTCGQHPALHCTACKQTAPKPCGSCGMPSEIDLCIACLVGLAKDSRSKPGHILFKVRALKSGEFVTVYDFKIPDKPEQKQEQTAEDILARIMGSTAVFCEHANEVPTKCPCPTGCYCKSHTCKGT